MKLLAVVLAMSFVAKWVHHEQLFRAEQRTLPVKNLSSVVSKLYHSGKKGKIHYNRGHRVAWGFPPKKIQHTAPQTDAVSYELSGGRLGDNLLSYLHALWLSYKDNRPMHYVPFPMGEHFALSQQSSSAPVAVTVPYFPEPSMKNRSQPFFVDWDDPGFQDKVHEALAPTKPVKLLPLPKDRITVAVHVRRPERFDNTSLYLEYPLKFPPDEYYLEQIRLVASVFKDKPLYIFLFTDSLEPEKLLNQYKSTLSLPNTEWARTSDASRVLEDFYAMAQFDCMILCDSSFSTTASKLGSYALRISPTHYSKRKGQIHVTGLDVAFNPDHKILNSPEKVLIAGVCQNTAHAVPYIRENAERLGKRFSDYAVLVYENNSTDDTAAKMRAWAEENPKVHVVSETLDSLPLSRTERIAQARNKVLSMAREYKDFQYLVMVDLDFTSPWPIQQIVRNTTRPGDWDCIAANGMYSNGDYYDRYALRTNTLPFGPELLGPWWWMQLQQGPVQFTGKDLVPVFSAFGGLAIYKRHSLGNHEYSGLVTRDLSAYYRQIELVFHGNKRLHPHVREYTRQLGLNPSSNLKPVPVVFVENTPEQHPDGIRRITCCEHLPLHASMAQSGCGKFFIDPEMIFVSEPANTGK